MSSRSASTGGSTRSDATLLDDLKRLVEPATLGDPARPLLWVSKSLDKLASALVAMGHPITPNSVRKLLIAIGFSRQVNRKADEGFSHPSNPSTPKSLRLRRLASPSFPWIRRKGNWSAITATPAATGSRRAIPNA